MLRPERRGELEVGQGGQGVDGMRQVRRHRRRVGEQGDTFAEQWFAQGGFFEQAVKSESDGQASWGFQTELRGMVSSSVNESGW